MISPSVNMHLKKLRESQPTNRINSWFCTFLQSMDQLSFQPPQKKWIILMKSVHFPDEKLIFLLGCEENFHLCLWPQKQQKHDLCFFVLKPNQTSTMLAQHKIENWNVSLNKKPFNICIFDRNVQCRHLLWQLDDSCCLTDVPSLCNSICFFSDQPAEI